MAHDVFISYSTLDKPIADAATAALEAAGIRCWIAPRDVLPGMGWGEAIVDAISDTSVMVLIFSSSSNDSSHVNREVERAVAKELPIVPFRIENVPFSKSIEFFLGEIHWLDALTPPLEAHLAELVTVVSSFLGRSARHDALIRAPESEPLGRADLDLWTTFDHGGLIVILGRFLREFQGFEESGVLGFGDAMALAELRGYLEAHGIHNFSVAYADFVHGDMLQSNLVLLGGPDGNGICREVMERLRPDIHFGDPDRYEVAVHDSITGETYVPTRVSGMNRAGTDFAIILRAPNPFASEREVLVIAGSFGYGTWAGVRFATSREFLEHDLVRTGARVECVIEADVVRETPQNVRLRVVRQPQP